MTNNRLEEIRAAYQRIKQIPTDGVGIGTYLDHVGTLLSALDVRPAVAADGEGNASDAEWESVSEAAAEIARLTKWQDLCFELLSEVRQWVAPSSIRDTDAPRALRALLSERAELKQRVTPVAADARELVQEFFPPDANPEAEWTTRLIERITTYANQRVEQAWQEGINEAITAIVGEKVDAHATKDESDYAYNRALRDAISACRNLLNQPSEKKRG